MEYQQNIKKGRGRPRMYFTEEEKKQARARNKAKFMAKKRAENGHSDMEQVRPRYSTDEEIKQAITKSKTKYMVNKEWCCDVCNGHNYTLAGKHCHLKSNKHIRNVIAIDIIEKVNNATNKK